MFIMTQYISAIVVSLDFKVTMGWCDPLIDYFFNFDGARSQVKTPWGFFTTVAGITFNAKG